LDQVTQNAWHGERFRRALQHDAIFGCGLDSGRAGGRGDMVTTKDDISRRREDIVTRCRRKRAA